MPEIPALSEFFRLFQRKDGIEIFRVEISLYSQFFFIVSKGLNIDNRINSF